MENHDVNGRVSLPVNDVPSALGVSRSLVYRLIASGDLRSFSVGRRRLVSVDALREFVATREGAAGGINPRYSEVGRRNVQRRHDSRRSA